MDEKLNQQHVENACPLQKWVVDLLTENRMVMEKWQLAESYGYWKYLGEDRNIHC
jgi:hypothetical protein